MMVSSLLFHRKVTTDLEKLDCKVNPCDICVANKMTHAKHFTVSWHADDLKISHKDKGVVSQFTESTIKKHEDSDIAKPNTSGILIGLF